MSKTTESTQPNKISKKLTKYLLSFSIFLLTLHLLLQYLNLEVYGESRGMFFELTNRFDFDDEVSVPTWFSQALLLLIGISSLLVAYLSKEKAKRRLWLAVGILGVLLSIDERASLHEFALQGIHNEYYLDQTATAAANAWLIILPLVIVITGLLAWQVIKHLPRRTVRIFILGGTIFLSGSILIDLISVDIDPNSYLLQGIYVAVEEMAEILGSILILYGVVDYIERNCSGSIRQLALKRIDR